MAEQLTQPPHAKQGPIIVGNPYDFEGTVFVMTHGGWHAPEHNLPLAEELLRRGYPSVLPRLDSDNVNLSFNDDTQTVFNSILGIDNPYLVGFSRGNETHVRLPEYIDTAKIVGMMAISWGGPHYLNNVSRLSRLLTPNRYARGHNKGIQPINKEVSTYNPDMAEKIFWSLLKDPKLLHMARLNLQPQRAVKINDSRAPKLPLEIPATSVVGLRDHALNILSAIHANHHYFGRRPRLKLFDHTPSLSAIEQTADLIISEAKKAEALRSQPK